MCGITACIRDPRINKDSVAFQDAYNGNGTNNVNERTNHLTHNMKSSAPADWDGRDETELLLQKLQASIDMLNHRGPDESGTWISKTGSVALGHCRLAINDLTPSGGQPLTSDDGMIHAIVNGEIYDHARLRKQCLENHGYRFVGESDSELVVALYKIHGCPGLFEYLRGEFAFVLCDERPEHKRVIAARDRFGIKPLVWTTVKDKILLAAEAKAFLPMGWQPEWDVKAIVASGWQLDDRTVFKGVKKLLPGHWLEITDEGVQIQRYWEADYKDKTEVDERDVNDMVLGVRQRLVESIRLRMQADVPIGVYLSGGIDSSAIAGIVTHLARDGNVQIGSKRTNNVACFSVEFPSNSGFDESSIAERTAEWLGIDVYKRKVTEDVLACNFEDTVYHCEHHNFDLNSVAKFCLSELPRQLGIKVVLTGEGSDEHFAGYPFFPGALLTETDWSQPNSILASQKGLRENLKKAVDEETRLYFKKMGGLTRKSTPQIRNAFKSPVPWNFLTFQVRRSLFSSWVQTRSDNLDNEDMRLDTYFSDTMEKIQSHWHPLHSALFIWNQVALSNVLLSCLGDRTEMAHSVEARTPFLDHHLTEYVNHLPPSVKMAYTPPVSNGNNEINEETKISAMNGVPTSTAFTEKWILREAVRPFVTDELYRRKKQPFLAPMKWPINGPLHKMLKKLLTKQGVEGLGFVDYAEVEASLGRAFGDDADTGAFRSLLCVAGWVTLGRRFGVKKVAEHDWKY